MYKIKDIPVMERPRERLITYGVESLSNEELLAIILKTGTKSKSAKLLASEILTKIDGIDNIKNLNLEFLTNIEGIGSAKACEILASIELGNRINKKIKSLKKEKFNNSKIVFDYYAKELGEKKQEYFYAIYLDSNKTIIKDKLLFVGTLNKSLVHPREVFKEAYLCSAQSIICVHNHPSGNTIPSKDDLELTDNLKKIGLLMGVPILDHIIIGSNNYYSFFENGDI